MAKEKMIKAEKKIDREHKSIEEQRIDEFIGMKETDATGDYNYYSFPLMMRLNRNSMARLEHLAKIWKLKKSNLACQLLEEMIDLVMDRYYKDKTQEEYTLAQREAFDDLNKKIEAMKKKRGNK